jgi:hypothetical protein
VQAIQSALPTSTKPTTTTKTKTAKANTSQPRAAGRITKPTSTTTVKKPRTKTQKVVDAIVGTGEKVVGDVEGRPGKKVCI